MTNSEVAMYIKDLRHMLVEGDSFTLTKEMYDSLSTAISAMESIDKITAERDAAVEQLHRNLVCCTYCKKIEEYQYPDDCECYDICKEGRGKVDYWEWKGIG